MKATRWFLSALILSFAGCQFSQPPHPASTPVNIVAWHTQMEQLSSLQSFRLNGRLQISYASEQHTVRFYWEHHDLTDYLVFKDWMGRTLLIIDGTQQPYIVTFDNQETLMTSSLEQAANKVLQLNLPAHTLLFWIRGLPAADLPIESLLITPEGFTHSLSQHHWKLAWEDYHAVGAYFVPHRLEIEHPETGQIILKIHQWELPPATG